MKVLNWMLRLVLRKDKPTALESALCAAIASEDTRKANGLAMRHFIHVEDWRRAAVCRDRLGSYRTEEFEPQNPTGQQPPTEDEI